jgi:hypothetical protein
MAVRNQFLSKSAYGGAGLPPEIFIEDEFDEATRAIELARQRLTDFNLTLQDEINLIGASKEATEKNNLMRQAAVLVEEAQIKNGEMMLGIIESGINRLHQWTAIHKVIVDTVGELQEERHMLGMASNERERYIIMRDAEKALDDAGVESKETYLKILEQEIILLEQAREAQRRVDQYHDRIRTMAVDIGDAFAHSFSDAVFQVNSLNDALKNLAMTISQAVFMQMAARPIGTAISEGIMGAFGVPVQSYMGNVFMGGNVIPFAKGGVVSQPGYFGMGGGSYGSIAEFYNPEAIVPLKRMPDGTLGVGSMGGGGVNVNMTVVTKDANSFRKSSAQTINEINRRVQQARMAN